MAKELGKVKKDPLFLALTRPAMLMGVPYGWCMGNLLITAVIYLYGGNSFLWLFLGGGTGHLIGYMCASYEPRFMDIIKVWSQTVPKCLNRFYHKNTCSYDTY
jgi:type IV secretion system protein VirB3